MMLSRLAENIYWAGRYLERAEDTARLVRVHTELFLDLPRSVSMGWTPLLAVTGAAEAYEDHMARADAAETMAPELHIVSFLTTDRDNSSSVLSSVQAARDNLRSVRALIPRGAWEQVNRLNLWAQDTQAMAAPRRSRAEWTDRLIQQCQTINGLLDSTMSHDQAFAFLLLGRFVERADMTTRVLDVQAQTLLEDPSVRGAYADVTWMSVLRSVSAMQMYRRVARAGISGSRALNFLLTDMQFPRSVCHGLGVIDRQLALLPHADAPVAAVEATRTRIAAAELDADLKPMAPEQLHTLMDDLQGKLGDVHAAISDAWFAPPPRAELPVDAHDGVSRQTPRTVSLDDDQPTGAQTQWQSTSP